MMGFGHPCGEGFVLGLGVWSGREIGCGCERELASGESHGAWDESSEQYRGTNVKANA